MNDHDNQDTFDFSARFDVPVCDKAGGRRHLILELRTPPVLQDLTRQPLDLAFVVDASSSMSGSPLESVKQALSMIAGALRDEDRVSLVSFANDVRIHVHGASIGEGGRAALLAEASQLQTRGNTNLSAGWLAGVELARSQPGEGRRRAVVLLSDGQANAGVVDPVQLGRLAARSANQGVATTCVGVGHGYSTAQLGVISDASGGRFHHADTPEAIVEVLVGELGELAVVAAERLELRLAAPQGMGVQVLSGATARVVSGQHRLKVGAAYRGTPRTIVVALDAPARSAGFEETLHATLIGRDASGAALRLASSARLAWGDASGMRASEADALLVARSMAAWLGQQALNHNEAGDYHMVHALGLQHMGILREQLEHASAACSELDNLQIFMDSAQRSMDQAERKRMYVNSRKALYQERDLRGTQGDQS